MHISIKIEPKVNSWDSYTVTGTEISEKGIDFSVISEMLLCTIMPFH